MKSMIKRTGIALAMALVVGTAAMPVQAYYDPYNNGPYHGSAYNNYGYGGIRGYLDSHPYVKKAAIGGGVGLAAGALLAGDGSRGSGAVKGALLGGAAGAGLQFLQNRGLFGGNRYGYNNRYGY